MTKIKAALIHLALSILALSILFSIVYFIWYPKPFFEISGTIEPLKLLVLIDVIVGPVLTFVVYKKGKSTLVMDLTIIALLQIAALVYGAYTIYGGRPTLIVMHNGKMNYLVHKFADYKELDESLKPHFLSAPKYGDNNNQFTQDLYQDSKNIQEADDFKKYLKPFASSQQDMLNQFPKIDGELKRLSSQYKDDTLHYFILDKDGVVYHVLYSEEKQRIVDRIKFN